MSGIEFTWGLKSAIRWNQRKILKFLLKMEDGRHVLPGMEYVNLDHALSTAINANKMEVIRFLLERALDGSYLLPGVKVTEDMLTLPYLGREMRDVWRGI